MHGPVNHFAIGETVNRTAGLARPQSQSPTPCGPMSHLHRTRRRQPLATDRMEVRTGIRANTNFPKSVAPEAVRSKATGGGAWS
jgi:hypothetical protein